MSSVIKQTIKGHVYLYESISYRDEHGRPRSKRVLIGKADPVTGKPIYKAEYIDRMRAEGKPIEEESEVKKYSETDVKHSRVKELGASYLYRAIAERTGLLDVLQDTIPEYWEQVYTIACFLVSCNEPVMYCADWAEKTDGLPTASVSPSSISRLFKEITVSDRNRFFEGWGMMCQENEYLALDITSISTYSELIEEAEWGYNRDKEKLPQINLCLLLGEKTRLPVFQTVYSGSLKDVSTLKTTLETAAALSFSNLMAVMDKGFYSATNVNALMSAKTGLRFLLAASFSSSFTKTQVENARNCIDLAKNTITVGDDSVLGVVMQPQWGGSRKIYAHVFYNVVQAAISKQNLYAEVASLAEIAKSNPDNSDHKKAFKKYLSIDKPANGNCAIGIRQDVVETELAYSGWLVILSNHIKSAAEAIRIYRAKDVVEKGFYRLKNNLELGRLRVHSNEAMLNKVFVGFIALIIMSYIHNVMLDNGLYYKMTMKKLISVLEKIRVHYIRKDRIIVPLTKEQTEILNAFKLPLTL